jgi:hypothetical protein
LRQAQIVILYVRTGIMITVSEGSHVCRHPMQGAATAKLVPGATIEAERDERQLRIASSYGIPPPIPMRLIQVK